MSKKFVICIEGSGGGCDYTIGCNKRFDEYSADSLDDLLLEFHEDHEGQNYMSGDRNSDELSYETVYVVEGGFVDVSDKLRAMIMNENNVRLSRAALKAEKEERALYKKLHEKYGKK